MRWPRACCRSRDWFRTQYYNIDPAGYGVLGSLSEEDFEYTWENFEDGRKFYQKAAADGRWVIFTVDQ